MYGPRTQLHYYRVQYVIYLMEYSAGPTYPLLQSLVYGIKYTQFWNSNIILVLTLLQNQF